MRRAPICSAPRRTKLRARPRFPPPQPPPLRQTVRGGSTATRCTCTSTQGSERPIAPSRPEGATPTCVSAVAMDRFGNPPRRSSIWRGAAPGSSAKQTCWWRTQQSPGNTAIGPNVLSDADPHIMLFYIWRFVMDYFEIISKYFQRWGSRCRVFPCVAY